MYPSMSQVAELQQTQIDSLKAVASTLVDAAERMANLHLAAARALMQEANQVTENLLGSADPQHALALVSELVQPSAQKLASFSRNFYDVAFGAQAELARVIESRLLESNGKLVGIVESTLQDAPAGSEPTLALFRQTVSASNAACDAIAKAARQALELAGSNLSAATIAGAEAARSAAQAAVKSRGRKSA